MLFFIDTAFNALESCSSRSLACGHGGKDIATGFQNTAPLKGEMKPALLKTPEPSMPQYELDLRSDFEIPDSSLCVATGQLAPSTLAIRTPNSQTSYAKVYDSSSRATPAASKPAVPNIPFIEGGLKLSRTFRSETFHSSCILVVV